MSPDSLLSDSVVGRLKRREIAPAAGEGELDRVLHFLCESERFCALLDDLRQIVRCLHRREAVIQHCQ